MAESWLQISSSSPTLATLWMSLFWWVKDILPKATCTTGRVLSSLILFFLQVAEKILLHMDNAYKIPHLRGRGAACRTNLPSNTAFRGFGVPQSLMIVENMLTDVALVLGRPAHQVAI